MLSATINLTVMVSDMCYGKCNVNVPAVCLHKVEATCLTGEAITFLCSEHIKY